LSQINLYGKASQREFKLAIKTEDLDLTVLAFLQKNQFPIASSCSGEGVCKKCIINQDTLSCKVTVAEWLTLNKRIEVSYL
jgi:Na+-transporting NADH:ubiquinone oxidoreductase subunit NqrF